MAPIGPTPKKDKPRTQFHSPIPDPAVEPIQTTAIVIIHPGSANLRLGRASDSVPVCIPHIIAKRHKTTGQPVHEDYTVLRYETNHAECEQQMDQGLRKIEREVWSLGLSTGQRRITTSPEQVSVYNSTVIPQQLDDNSGLKWTDTQHLPEYVVGEEALYISPQDCYNFHRPFRCGGLNLHQGIGGSLTSVIQDLQIIWSSAIENQLEIPVKDLKHYRAVLLIPDIYNRPHVKELMSLLLNRLGFGAAIVIQESVCATFGSGVQSACVVDIGDQKTSISCVEDGLSHRNTRLRLSFGGSDITRCFAWLLSRVYFPYKECDLASRMDSLLMQELKESFCHLEPDIYGPQLHEFHIRQPHRPTVLYQIKLGDEGIQAPMSIFNPQVFGLAGKNLFHTQQRNIGDSEDPHDETYLLQTQSRESVKSKSANAEDKNKDGGANPDEVKVKTENAAEEKESEEPELLQPLSMSSRMATSEFADRVPGLDEAILHSISCCSSDETKKKMYGTILVIGGGLQFQGAQEMLHRKILKGIPEKFRSQVESVDVICKAKELDSKMTCWKGGAVLCCLDTSQELWIRQREWQHYGLKVLRERSPFVW
ncbi:actin-related protein 8-like [Saccoglossus kowalevskii]|uniref:Actin-related protein 8-like n=1 Tax=Saccoglossus kowalevskii TaxID=10224 RepID=A0ABM0GIG0_SACKO|nr:PREDICTED: actin-related protein 8-like [Saccoglossus kowalevskii]